MPRIIVKPKAEFCSYNGRDCETFYKCPVCKRLFSSWLMYNQPKNENGTDQYCPLCKAELEF